MTETVNRGNDNTPAMVQVPRPVLEQVLRDLRTMQQELDELKRELKK